VTGDGASARCRLTREQFEIAFEAAAIPPAASLPLLVLGRCWLPRELARHRLQSHGFRWARHFEPAAGPVLADAGESDCNPVPAGSPRKARPGPNPTADRIKYAAAVLVETGLVPAKTIT